MSYIYHGKTDWIKQPNRVVQTFRSGLCMIQQDYIRRADDQIDYFTFREGDPISPEDASPCIDGAYIFPAPTYQDMGNGFIKCTVTAYGRVNTTGVVRVTKRVGNYVTNTIFLLGQVGSNTSSVGSQKIFDVINFNFVAYKSEIVPIPTSPRPLIYDLNLTPLPIGEFRISNSSAPGNSAELVGTTVSNYVLNQVVELYEVNSYGDFIECNISIAATGSLSVYA
jgi:hypothetical protein